VPSAARLSWPLELLTRGFASLPFNSFALSLQKLLNSIIEHFEDEVNYYSDGHWFVCYLLLEKKAGIYVLFLDLKKRFVSVYV